MVMGMTLNCLHRVYSIRVLVTFSCWSVVKQQLTHSATIQQHSSWTRAIGIGRLICLCCCCSMVRWATITVEVYVGVRQRHLGVMGFDWLIDLLFCKLLWTPKWDPLVITVHAARCLPSFHFYWKWMHVLLKHRCTCTNHLEYKWREWWFQTS